MTIAALAGLSLFGSHDLICHASQEEIASLAADVGIALTSSYKGSSCWTEPE